MRLKFTFANKIEAMYERSHVRVKVSVETLSTSRLTSTLYISRPVWEISISEYMMTITDNCMLSLQRKISIHNAFAPLLFWSLLFIPWDHKLFSCKATSKELMWNKRKVGWVSATQRKIYLKWIQRLCFWCIVSRPSGLQISGIH